MTVWTNILISFVRVSSSTQPVTLSFCVGVVVEIRSAGCFLCRRLVVTHLSPVSGDGERNFISVRNIHPSYLSAETLISTSASHTSPLCPSPILSFSSRLLSFFLSYHLCFVCFRFSSSPVSPFLRFSYFVSLPFLFYIAIPSICVFISIFFCFLMFPFLIPFLSFMFWLLLVLQFLSCISFPLFCCPFLFPFAFMFPSLSILFLRSFLFYISLPSICFFLSILFCFFPFLLSSFLPSLLVSCFFSLPSCSSPFIFPFLISPCSSFFCFVSFHHYLSFHFLFVLSVPFPVGLICTEVIIVR